MLLQREVVARLAGSLALQLSWLGPLPWLEATPEEREQSREAVAEEQRGWFVEMIAQHYTVQGHIESLLVDVYPHRADAIAVTFDLRVHPRAFRASLPGMLDDALREDCGFLARAAAGLRPAAAV